MGWRLGVGSWTVLGAAVVCAGPGFLVGSGIRRRSWLRVGIRLVPAGLPRTVLPVVPREPVLLPFGEHYEHSNREHQSLFERVLPQSEIAELVPLRQHGTWLYRGFAQHVGARIAGAQQPGSSFSESAA